MARTRDSEAQAERLDVRVLHLAVRAGDLQFPEDEAHDDQRDHLGPPRAEHGGTTRRFTSVHDNIGFFAVSKAYYFDLDPVRIPYDADTKKARSRKLFEGSKWLEMGYNPKDVWSVSRLHRQHAERVDHPTQKPLEIIERMVLASCPPGGRVLDPFMGSGTTAVACARQGATSSATRSTKVTARSRASACMRSRRRRAHDARRRIAGRTLCTDPAGALTRRVRIDTGKLPCRVFSRPSPHSPNRAERA